MTDFRLHNNYRRHSFISIAIIIICTQTIYTQSLYDSINEAKNFWSDDPDVTETFNTKQQLANLYNIVPLIKSSEHNDTIGILYYYITHRHYVLNEIQEVKKNATISLDYLLQSDYDDYIIPFLYQRRAVVNKLLGYHQEVLDDIKSIFDLNLRGRSLEIIGDAQRLMASMYSDKGDHESAINQLHYFLNSSLVDSLDAYSKATILKDLSISYLSYRDSLSIQRAVEAIEESNLLIPNISDQYGEQSDVKISNGMQMGLIHYSNHNYEAAIQSYENTLSLIDKNTANLNLRRFYNITLANLIELYGSVGQSQNIASLIDEHNLLLPEVIALELQDSYALLNENLSTYYRHKKQYSKAQDYLTAAFSSLHTSELQPANQLKTNSYKQRLTKLIRAKIELNKDLYAKNKGSDYLKIALQDMYKLDSLIDFVNQDILFESSILNWRQEAKSFYNLGIQVAYDLDDKNAFWKFSEKAKSLALLESISNEKLFLNNDTITKSVQELKELQLDETKLQQQLLAIATPTVIDSIQKEITTNKNKQNTILIERNSIFQKQIPETIPLSEIQSTDEKTSIVQYVVTEDKVYAILVHNNQASLHNLGPSAGINNQVLNFRQHLLDEDNDNSNFEIISQNLQKLRTLLITPLKELNQNIIIIPEDFLFHLPFESLLSEKGRYLIQDHTIHYELSGTLSNHTRRTDHSQSKQTTIVSPEYTSASYSPLLHAQEEALKVQSLTDGELFKTISKNELISQYTKSQVFHFSGHALVNQGFQNNSYLALSDTSQLSENEIYNYPNQLNMVVLSGCDTGAGTILKGEGISNLSRAFIYAGSKSVLQSLWSIDDLASQTLIQYFYEGLKKGNTKSQALREAKLNYLNTVDDFHKHPYYWSAFVLVGDDSAISFSSVANRRLYVLGFFGLICLGLIPFLYKKISVN